MGLIGSLVISLALPVGLLVPVASPSPTAEPDPPAPQMRTAPSISGQATFGETLTARRGVWRPAPQRTRFQWLRDGEPIQGATEQRYSIAPGDVGHRLRVLVRVRPDGPWAQAKSEGVRARHRVGVRRRVSYHVETRGKVSASLATFKRLAQQTYDDPRGWRGAGVKFTRVKRGGDFTLVLANAATMTTFSSSCSSQWSCRVGRYVVINQTRWQHASPAWNQRGGSLRDYRHMVVNHETGHWLGFSHATCPGRGQPAPVMMQQSKGLNGCRFNPWPTRAEQHRV